MNSKTCENIFIINIVNDQDQLVPLDYIHKTKSIVFKR